VKRKTPNLYGATDSVFDGASRHVTSQSDIDHPRDRRERDGEAFDMPPLGFGHVMRYGGHQRQPRDWPETVGSILGAAIVVGVALFLAWMASRGLR
jgi:hypothetical protein